MKWSFKCDLSLVQVRVSIHRARLDGYRTLIAIDVCVSWQWTEKNVLGLMKRRNKVRILTARIPHIICYAAERVIINYLSLSNFNIFSDRIWLVIFSKSLGKSSLFIVNFLFSISLKLYHKYIANLMK